MHFGNWLIVCVFGMHSLEIEVGIIIIVCVFMYILFVMLHAGYCMWVLFFVIMLLLVFCRIFDYCFNSDKNPGYTQRYICTESKRLQLDNMSYSGHRKSKMVLSIHRHNEKLLFTLW